MRLSTFLKFIFKYHVSLPCVKIVNDFDDSVLFQGLVLDLSIVSKKYFRHLFVTSVDFLNHKVQIHVFNDNDMEV